MIKLAEEEVISQIIPYLQYFLIFGAVVAGIVGAVKWIHRKGIVSGVETTRGKSIESKIDKIDEKLDKRDTESNVAFQTVFKKVGNNFSEIQVLKIKVDNLDKNVTSHGELSLKERSNMKEQLTGVIVGMGDIKKDIGKLEGKQAKINDKDS